MQKIDEFFTIDELVKPRQWTPREDEIVRPSKRQTAIDKSDETLSTLAEVFEVRRE